MARLSHWIPALSMLLVSLISYIDRHTLALLAPSILAECRLSAEQYGYIISAFSLTYMAGNPVWGTLLDRIGVRRGMGAAVTLWTSASTAHAFAGGFAGFAAARAALGLGEAATFPGSLRAVVQTLPETLRARGVAVAYSGGSLGAILTPLIITPIFAWFGWRAAFLFTGLIGLAWLALWSRVSRHPQLAAPHPAAHAARPPVRWRDPRLWSFVLSYALGGLPLAFVLYHAALYFSSGLGKSQVEIGAVLWIPPLGWEAGYFLWGWLADRGTRTAVGRLVVYRRLTLLALVLMLPFAWTPRAGSFAGVLALMFLAMLVAGGNLITAVGYATHAFTPHNAGLIAGLGAGSWSALVALTMPFFGRLADQRRFEEAFLLATLIPVAGLLAWLALNARRRQA
jgi:ACS family hexuronate transporter-like MFS transporter